MGKRTRLRWWQWRKRDKAAVAKAEAYWVRWAERRSEFHEALRRAVEAARQAEYDRSFK